MRSADEVTLVYTSNGASTLTSSASAAFIVINSCEIVNYLNCTVRTNLSAFAAGDTSVRAIFANLCALLMAVALDDDARRVLDKVNNSVRTFLCAKSAAYAFS